MQKETLVLILGLAGVTGWIYREPIMNRINPPPPPPVTTSDMAPEGSVYKHSGESANSGSGIYSWKDKDGKMHYGNRAGSEDAQAVTLSKGNTVSLGGKHGGSAPEPVKHTSPAKNTYVPPNKQAEQKLHGAAMKQQAELNAMDEINR